MALRRPCLGCGAIIPSGSRCPACTLAATRRTEATRPSRGQRGYGKDYQANRKIMIDRAWRNGEPCIRCGKRFRAKSEITAEHIVPKRHGGGNETENLAPCCAPCNIAWNKRRG